MNEKTKAAVVAGVALGVLAILTALASSAVGGAGCCSCLWPIGAGVLAVYLYAKKSTGPLQISDGAMLGLIAGVVGGLIYLVIGIPLAYVVSRAALETQIDQLRERGIEMPVTGFLLFFLTGILSLVVYVILAAIGGLIGAAIFGKNRPGATPPPPPGNFGGTPGNFGGMPPPNFGGAPPPPPPPAGGGFGSGL